MQARRSSLYTPKYDPFLIAHYTFEEGTGAKVIDSSGNENHLTVHGGVWDTVVAKEGTYSFLATASSHRAIADKDLFPPLGDFSFCAWIRLTNTTTGNPEVFSSRKGGLFGTVTGISLGTLGYIKPQGFGASLEDNKGNMHRVHNDNYFPAVKVWYAVTVTVVRNPQKITIYRDGVDITGSCAVENLGTPDFANKNLAGLPTVLNNRPGLSDRGMIGRYDDVRLYSRVLTPQEALDYYNQTF